MEKEKIKINYSMLVVIRCWLKAKQKSFGKEDVIGGKKNKEKILELETNSKEQFNEIQKTLTELRKRYGISEQE